MSVDSGSDDFGGDTMTAGNFGPDASTPSMTGGAKNDSPEEAPRGAKRPSPMPQANGGKDGQAAGDSGKKPSDARSPILIYRADFTMSVYEVKKSLDEIEAVAKRSGGYLSRREDALITIRIPAAEFPTVIAELEKIGDVLNRNVVSEDVTAEYRDLEVQLQNLQALRNRFEKLLEKAQKVEEALQIERELGRITGEIERIKGRLKLLTDLAQYSTITVRFQPKVTQNVDGGPFVLPLPWLQGLGLPGLLTL